MDSMLYHVSFEDMYKYVMWNILDGEKCIVYGNIFSYNVTKNNLQFMMNMNAGTGNFRLTINSPMRFYLCITDKKITLEIYGEDSVLHPSSTLNLHEMLIKSPIKSARSIQSAN